MHGPVVQELSALSLSVLESVLPQMGVGWE